MALADDATCAAYGKAANTACTGCLEGVTASGGSAKTYYCSRQCQKIHWTTHKAACKLSNDRKQVFRAADLLQGLFYMLRKHTFDINLTAAIKQEAQLHIQEIDEPTDWPLCRFPEELFASDNVAHAALAWNTCECAVGWLSKVVKEAFKGTGTQICEIECEIKNTRQRIVFNGVRINADPNATVSHAHVVFMITIRDNSAYAIDLSSAQYGITTTFQPWANYEQELERVTHIRGSGFRANSQKELYMPYYAAMVGDRRICIDTPSLSAATQYEVGRELEATVARWFKEKGGDLREVLRAKSEVHKSAIAGLSASVDVGMEAFTPRLRRIRELMFKSGRHVTGQSREQVSRELLRSKSVSGNADDVADLWGLIPNPLEDAQVAGGTYEEYETWEQRVVADFKAGGGKVITY